jgi:hypothetical protein
MAKYLQLMVLLNSEVWDNAEDYERAAQLMCLVYRIPATEKNKTSIMDRGKVGNPWNICEKADGTEFYSWQNSIENILGDNGEVLMPAIITQAKAQISRPDTRFEVGFEAQEWFEYWGVVEYSQSSSSSSED